MLTLTLIARRIMWLIRSRFTTYTVAPAPVGFRRTMMRTYNQRRERGNVLRYLKRRSGRYHVTSAILLALLLNTGCGSTPTEPRVVAVDCVDASTGLWYSCSK
jgi:hypothetical protein